MKVCLNKRKAIALLALDELNARQARELRAHLESCDGCRNYLAEISSVTETLAQAKTTPDIQTSESFHRQVVARLEAEAPVSMWETARLFLRGILLNWRVAVPVAASVILVVGLVAERHKPAVRHPPLAQANRHGVLEAGAYAGLPPTIGNYEAVASQSLDKFDALLDEQAKKAAPPVPDYTASTLIEAGTQENPSTR
jgi:anti-sigma factor RsiW